MLVSFRYANELSMLRLDGQKISRPYQRCVIHTIQVLSKKKLSF